MTRTLWLLSDENCAGLRELSRAGDRCLQCGMAHNEDRIPALRGGFHLHTVKRVDFTELVTVVKNLTAL
jgi:hypothetical protein